MYLESHNETESSVLKEQLRLLYDALPLSIIATLINTGILLYILQPYIELNITIGWGIAVLITALIRLVSYLLYKKNGLDYEYLSRSLKIFNVGTLLAAITWGIASLLLFVPGEITYQVFFAFVIAGMSAGAVTSLSFRRMPIYAFLSFSLIPLIIRLFTEGGEINIAMGFMVLLFFLILFSTANRTYTRVRENILLRIEADNNEKVIRESEEKYRSIFETAPVGILQFNQSGRVVSGNSSAARILSLKKDALQDINLLSNVENKEFTQAVKRSMQGNFSQFAGDASLLNSKAEIPVRMYLKGVKSHDDSVVSGVAILEDISEQQRVEQLKTEFVSTVSHELRTPLTAIKGSIGLLNITPVEKTADLIDILKRNVDRLIVLINDLLDMEKIISGNMSFDYKNWGVEGLISQAAEDNQGYASEHQSELIVVVDGIECEIYVDKNRFHQVMSNLISNAVKFTREGTPVTIDANQDSDYVTINIIDQGEGIPEEFREKLFERFTQADSSTTRKIGGTGLGLYITQQLVTAMGGEVSYKTESGVGTRFSIKFPLIK